MSNYHDYEILTMGSREQAGRLVARTFNGESSDIVEQLRKWAAMKVGPTLNDMHARAANTIAQLRYDHERDVEKIAALQLRLEQYRFVTDERIDG